LADLDTPLSLYLKLAQGQPYSFLLESVVGGERFGRYSFIGLPARTLLRATGHQTEVVTDGQVVETDEGNPLDFIAAVPAALQGGGAPGPAALLRRPGRLLRLRHRALHRAQAGGCTWKPGGIGTPDILLLQTEELAVIDNLSAACTSSSMPTRASPSAYFPRKQAPARTAAAALSRHRAAGQARPRPYPVERDFAKADSMAGRAPRQGLHRRRRLHAGGDRPALKKRFTESPLALYRALRSLNPSRPTCTTTTWATSTSSAPAPRSWCARSTTPTVAARSPSARSPARARAAPRPSRTRRNEAELLADPKERAEHLMLIDLARNDIGRIAKTGSVKVTEAFGIERYSHVMHIVSNVEGMLKDGMTSLDVLRATFPAGTLSGAPKIRAMEIIDELEPVQARHLRRRCGYLSFAGDMDVAIAIRTGVIKDQTLYVQAGAGVVADSVPELEWKETEPRRAR
jgi:anthranilate synthase component 1